MRQGLGPHLEFLRRDFWQVAGRHAYISNKLTGPRRQVPYRGRLSGERLLLAGGRGYFFTLLAAS